MPHKNTLTKRIEVTGDSLSPGIAIGNTYRFKQIDLESLRKNSFPIENITIELERLDHSIKKSKDQLLSLQKTALENQKKDVADIFAAHVQLLQDQTFIQSIKDAVKLELLNVEHILSVKIGDLDRVSVLSATKPLEPVCLISRMSISAFLEIFWKSNMSESLLFSDQRVIQF